MLLDDDDGDDDDDDHEFIVRRPVIHNVVSQSLTKAHADGYLHGDQYHERPKQGTNTCLN
eukprot:3417512-Karenia_brevis.AAC.1